MTLKTIKLIYLFIFFCPNLFASSPPVRACKNKLTKNQLSSIQELVKKDKFYQELKTSFSNSEIIISECIDKKFVFGQIIVKTKNKYSSFIDDYQMYFNFKLKVPWKEITYFQPKKISLVKLKKMMEEIKNNPKRKYLQNFFQNKVTYINNKDYKNDLMKLQFSNKRMFSYLYFEMNSGKLIKYRIGRFNINSDFKYEYFPEIKSALKVISSKLKKDKLDQCIPLKTNHIKLNINAKKTDSKNWNLSINLGNCLKCKSIDFLVEGSNLKTFYHPISTNSSGQCPVTK